MYNKDFDLFLYIIYSHFTII